MGKKVWKKCLYAGMAATVLASVSLGIVPSAAMAANTSGEAEYGGAEELTDGTRVSAVAGLTETSPDGTLRVRIMTDSATGRYFYTVEKNGRTILQASQLGLEADEDYTRKLVYLPESKTVESGTEAYTLTSGARTAVNDPFREISFDLGKNGEKAPRHAAPL